MNHEWLADDIADRMAGIQGIGGILKNHLQIASQRFQLPGSHQRQIVPVEQDLTGIGLEHARNGLAQRGLAATGFSDETQRFTGADFQRDVIHRPALSLRGQKHATPHGKPGSQLADLEQ